MAARSAIRWRWWSRKLGLERDWYLIFIAAVIGLLMGCFATAFILPLRWIEQWTLGADPNLLLVLVPLAPIVGGLLAGLVIRMLSDKGDVPGVSAVMYSIHRRKSKLALHVALGKWVASTLTIGSGGSAGAEGPIVTIGSVIGSNIGRAFKANAQNTATLLGCGAAAGIASVFNAPIAGIFFVLEVLLRDFSIRTFTPIVIASVISAAWTQALLGQNDALFATQTNFTVGPFTAAGIPNYLMLGLLCGAVGAIFTRSLFVTERLFARLKAPHILKPAIGAAMLGLIGLAFLLIVGASFGAPPFYGNGYPVIRQLLDPISYIGGSHFDQMGWLLLVLIAIAVLKALATCLTIGSGGSGGLFAPSLLLGASVGGAFGYLVEALAWFRSTTPAHYALLGMAAMIAATAHAPLTAILLVYEMTRSYEIILPLMFATVISTIAARLIYPESVYSAKLTQMGVRIGALSDLTILRRMTVQDVPVMPAVLVQASDSAQKLLELSEQHLVRDFVVVDGDNRYLGLVTGTDLAAALVYREAIPLLQVSELQRSDLPTVSRDETLDMVLDKFSKNDAQSLAILDETGKEHVVGLITRARLMDHYHAALIRD